MPKGVVQGQNMLHILRQSTGNLPAFKSFDELPVHYRAVATDIVNLKPVVLKDGELVDAMMASMSVPGALPPYPYKGMLLVDGGVTNNMPVELARSMGADVIIAVDISTDYKSIEQLNTFLSVGDQLSNYLVRRSTQDLEPDDIFIRDASTLQLPNEDSTHLIVLMAAHLGQVRLIDNIMVELTNNSNDGEEE